MSQPTRKEEPDERQWQLRPEEVAARIQPIIDAGATHVDIIDTLPLILDSADVRKSRSRQLDVCARIKKANQS